MPWSKVFTLMSKSNMKSRIGAQTRSLSENQKVAVTAGLRYVTDSQPGLTRKRIGRGFRYLDVHGKLIRHKPTLVRIEQLAIPPAWNEVWICPIENGHIQATGRDDRRRKQYVYHSSWRAIRDANKFDQLLEFARLLPGIRKRIFQDTRSKVLSREKVLATIIQLLESTLIRVGNDEYARTNQSYGLTTMRRKHVNVTSNTIRFQFPGKSGVDHDIQVHDKQIVKVIRNCQELPGQELFKYRDDTGTMQDVTSQDVNDYLQKITGQEVTAKQFRTWAGTTLAIRALQKAGEFDSEFAAKRNVTQAIRDVASQLGNTISVCRNSYVHPVVIESYLNQSLSSFCRTKPVVTTRTRSAFGLSVEEKAMVKLLRQRKYESGRAHTK